MQLFQTKKHLSWRVMIHSQYIGASSIVVSGFSHFTVTFTENELVCQMQILCFKFWISVGPVKTHQLEPSEPYCCWFLLLSEIPARLAGPLTGVIVTMGHSVGVSLHSHFSVIRFDYTERVCCAFLLFAFCICICLHGMHVFAIIVWVVSAFRQSFKVIV